MPSQRTIEHVLRFAAELGEIDLAILREGLELAHLHHQLERAIENDMAGRGMTAKQVEIMEVLYHNTDTTITPAELSDEVGLTRSAMTSALDSIEKMGYLVRNPHPTDRRMVAVTLTPAGTEQISRYLPDRYRKFHRIVGSLTPVERKTMLHAYEKLIALFASDADSHSHAGGSTDEVR